MTTDVLPDDVDVRENGRECARALLATEDVEHAGPDRGIVARVLRGFAGAGLFRLSYLDGPGPVTPRDMRAAARTAEGLAHESGTLSSIFQVNAVFGGAFIALLGSDEQRERWLVPLRDGRLQVAFALTEPSAGSDVTALATEARADGDAFVLKGEKTYTTGAATADRIIVIARLAGGGPREVGLFLVPPDAEGVSVEPLSKLAGDVHASCRVRLDGVSVDAQEVLGVPGAAWDFLKIGGLLERLTVAAASAGMAAGVVERTLEYARSREQFGKRIGEFQSIAHTVVDMQTAATTMRLLVDDALATIDRGDDPTRAVCTAKYFCAERAQEVVGAAMRVLGGRAYFHFEEIARRYREAPLSLYAGGTVEIQKNLVARTLGLG
jgi:alkylation response protein AidB-like acyl-CoA dehydrogenase